MTAEFLIPNPTHKERSIAGPYHGHSHADLARQEQMASHHPLCRATLTGMTVVFADPKVQAVFDSFPDDIRQIAFALRDLVFDVAADTPQAGQIEETLKWGQPAYLTPHTKSGSTLRIGAAKGGGCALFAHCATDIISTYATTFPKMERIEGNRAVIYKSTAEIVPDRLRLLISHGLTYHLRR